MSTLILYIHLYHAVLFFNFHSFCCFVASFPYIPATVIIKSSLSLSPPCLSYMCVYRGLFSLWLIKSFSCSLPRVNGFLDVSPIYSKSHLSHLTFYNYSVDPTFSTSSIFAQNTSPDTFVISECVCLLYELFHITPEVLSIKI